jgi:predicted ester cyclase
MSMAARSVSTTEPAILKDAHGPVYDLAGALVPLWMPPWAASLVEPLAGITSLRGYAEWMRGLLGFLPDGRYDLHSFAVDDERGSVVAFATFVATHTGEGGPCPPTGKSTQTDYVYVMQFEDGKIRHMTKIWNAGWAMRELGWT